MLAATLLQGGTMVWLLLAASALGVVVFVERRLEFHRVQINTTALLGGLKNVLGQDNLVEAIGICDATASPTAQASPPCSGAAAWPARVPAGCRSRCRTLPRSGRW